MYILCSDFNVKHARIHKFAFPENKMADYRKQKNTGLLYGEFEPDMISVSPINDTIKNKVLSIEMTDLSSKPHSMDDGFSTKSLSDINDIEQETNIGTEVDILDKDNSNRIMVNSRTGDKTPEATESQLSRESESGGSVDTSAEWEKFSPRHQSSRVSTQSSELDIPDSRTSGETHLFSTGSADVDFYCVDHMCPVTDEVWNKLFCIFPFSSTKL